MKKIVKAGEKLFIVLICFVSLLACKNGNGDSGGFFSGGKDFIPTTASELQEGWNTLPVTSLKYPKEAEEFYKTRSFAPVWNDKGLRKAFVEELMKAGEEGLSAKNYYTSRLQELLNSKEEPSEGERIETEVFLTDSFFRFANDLYYGKVNPKDLYSLWGIKRPKLNPAQVLREIQTKEDLNAALGSLKPQHPVYNGLKKSLQEYKMKMEQDTAIVKIALGKTIKPGDTDKRLSLISKRLQQLGYPVLDSLQNDSLYDKEEIASVKQFQEEKGLEPDGVIGNSTLRELNMDSRELYKKVLVNLERWRWFPRDLGDHYILVNVADFKLAVVKNGDTVRTHNVIAGSKERQTPVFTDTLEYIVINPLWNIPPTIQQEDIIPKASRNPSYLANNNMTVTAPNGDVLDPYEIDWSSPQVKNYRFSQSAGPSNPLGRVKIIYPNEYLIYLHDTPAKALFNRNDRAESSGCVRVENAVDLSAYVVENQEGWNLDRIKQQITSGVTKHVKIESPIQVHHFYWTAWRGLDKTYFADDVYDLDAEVYTALTTEP